MNREVRWQPRKWVSRLLRVLVFIIPLILGVAAATIVARMLPRYDSLVGGIAWWSLVLAVSFLVVNITDRITRTFLPLASLLSMSLVFPGAAPSRVKVALRTWTTAQLKARIQEAREQGIDDDPTRAGETVLVLVAALNAHDRLTRGHAERTRAFVDVLAEELGVPEEEREKLRWVALLHDVGKLKISEDVLNKEGRLDDDEEEVIKEHPTLGDELVRPIKPFLGQWADTILHHHERYDGNGYPLGLAGSEIAFGARIVAVADAFDAMTARRSYQAALSPRFALRELSENAGSQFDPVVVRAFLNISASRLRRVMGPLTVLAQVPFVAGFQRAAEWMGSVASGSLAVATAVAAGLVGPISVSQTAPHDYDYYHHHYDYHHHDDDDAAAHHDDPTSFHNYDHDRAAADHDNNHHDYDGAAADHDNNHHYNCRSQRSADSGERRGGWQYWIDHHHPGARQRLRPRR